ncbi:GNAT family N-acetyltransferase, partial [Candidatus Thorarchaeota archaeon]
EYQDEEDDYIKIWENQEKHIVAVTICKSSGECRIFIHPDYRDYERTLVSSIEDQRKKMKSDENSELKMFFIVEAGDRLRENLLEDLGYENKGVCEHNRILPKDLKVPEIKLYEDYSIRHVDIEKDFELYHAVQNSVFSHCTHMTLNRARIYSEAEFYMPELDLVVVAPDGSFAAFTTGRMDPVSKLAELEPVGVHPDHRKKGLGKAIVLETIRRLQEAGAAAIVILGAAGTEDATKLYDSVGFDRAEVNLWIKTA